MEFMKKLKSLQFTVSIIYILLGVVMLFDPNFILDAVNYIIGGFVLLYGLIYMINLLVKKDSTMINKSNFFVGIICLSFGIFLFKSDALKNLLPFCCGVILTVDALYQIYCTFKFKKVDGKYWLVNLIISLILLGFGVYSIIKAEEISEFIIRLLGAVLIIDAFGDFYSYFVFKKKVNNNLGKTIEVDYEEKEEVKLIDNK